MKRIVGFIGVSLALVQGCTMIAVGKRATIDGSTIVTHNDDAGGNTADLRLVVIPKKNNEPFTQRPVYRIEGGYPRVVSAQRSPLYTAKDGLNESVPLGFIPQVASTYSYIAQEYAIVNEVQLSIGESTCNAKTTGWPKNIPGGQAMFGLGELTSVAMERCDTARCAIQLMGDLATTHGFYSEYGGTPASPGYDSEALGITDKYGEVWVFHILAGPGGIGAIWAAQRVEDNHVAVVANHFTIATMNLTDKDRFLASDNVITAAIDNGWYTPQVNGSFDDFNFKAAYARAPPPSPVLYTDGRTWRVYNTFAPSLQLQPTFGYLDAYPDYPFSVPVDHLISLQDITTILRDQYQGTEFDLTQGLAAGPFGSPLRYSGFTPGVHGGWLNPISVHRTLYSYVAQAHSNRELHDALAGALWFGQSAPHGTVFIPISCAQSSLPHTFHNGAGKQGEFSLESAWWAFNLVNNWRALWYSRMTDDVNEYIKKYQNEAFLLVEKRNTRDIDEPFGNLDALHNGFAQRVVDARWELAWKLISKYSDGFITADPEGKMEAPGYPAWWLNQTNYVQWAMPEPSSQPIVHLNRKDTPGNAISFISLIWGVVIGAVAHQLYRGRRRFEYSPLP